MSDAKTNVVMVFGTFDYLHAGHENLFKQARVLGDYIVAIIARDKTVKTIKGEFPDHDEKARIKNLQDTGWADEIQLGNPKDKMKVIKTNKPNVIALGYDQFAFTFNLEKLLIDLKLDTKIVRLKPYRPDMYKSSILKKNRHEEESTIVEQSHSKSILAQPQ